MLTYQGSFLTPHYIPKARKLIFEAPCDRISDAGFPRWRYDMYEWVKNITSAVEPIYDSIYGPRYRCSLTLKDGTFLPCAVIQSRRRLVDFAKRRIKEEMQGQGRIGGEDPYGQIISALFGSRNRINDYEVLSSAESIYAIPLPLRSLIKGETVMGWTCWVFRMTDGRLFSYGSSFSMEF